MLLYIIKSSVTYVHKAMLYVAISRCLDDIVAITRDGQDRGGAKVKCNNNYIIRVNRI